MKKTWFFVSAAATGVAAFYFIERAGVPPSAWCRWTLAQRLRLADRDVRVLLLHASSDDSLGPKTADSVRKFLKDHVNSNYVFVRCVRRDELSRVIDQHERGSEPEQLSAMDEEMRTAFQQLRALQRESKPEYYGFMSNSNYHESGWVPDVEVPCARATGALRALTGQVSNYTSMRSSFDTVISVVQYTMPAANGAKAVTYFATMTRDPRPFHCDEWRASCVRKKRVDDEALRWLVPRHFAVLKRVFREV